MAERTLFPQWRPQQEPTRYPFADRATLVNAAGRVLVEGTFLDAALYPVGAPAGLYLAAAAVTHETVTLTLAAPGVPVVATAAFSLVSPPDAVAFADPYGRPAGVLVTEGRRLGLFQSWGVGVHEFRQDETEFAATCVFPAPEAGVRGVRLETGEVLTGDVWLVGGDGVVLRADHVEVPVPGTCRTREVTAIRVDVVGDPLFRRRLCSPAELFETPRFVTAVRVVGPNQEFTVGPEPGGNLRLFANNALAGDTVLRVTATPTGLTVAAAGGREV